MKPPNGDQGPGKPKPFVSDTLSRVLGIPLVVDRRPGGFMAPIGGAGQPLAGKFIAPDTLRTYGNQPDHVIAHEAGHLLDYLHLTPETNMAITARSREYKRKDYFSADPNEYVAEAFARAVESARHGFSDSTKVDKKFPGAIEMIRWLQTRPPFAKSEATGEVSQPTPGTTLWNTFLKRRTS